MLSKIPAFFRSPVALYASVIVGVAVAMVLRLPFEPFLRGATPYALYYIPILASAWYGTVGSTLFAIAASLALAITFSIAPSSPANDSQVASALLFLVVSGTMSALVRVVRGDREARADAVNSSARLAAIVASSDDAIVSKNLDGIVQSWNAGAERIFGYTADEVVGQSITVIIPPELRAEESGILERLRRGERVDHFETLRVAKDGRRVDVSLSISPVYDLGGRVIGASKIARDISERRRLDAERREAALERERLLESECAARSEAERANRMKDDFVATLSHELRTPLNAVLGWTELMRRAGDQPETHARGLEVIERNTKLQAQLVSDLLDVSGMVSGKLKLELQETSLAAAIFSAVETVTPLARTKGVTLSTRLQEDLPPIAGDPARLQQVVWNLLLNAIKFTPQGGRIDLTLDLVDGAARIVVADTGIGIRPEFLGALFERFRQGDPSTSRRHGGLGLGLAIVKHLVEEHGGTVSAASEGEGRGATFVIRLPVGGSVSRRDAARGANALRQPGTPLEARLSDVRVLLVEDDRDTRELLERILYECGARVTAVASGPEALEALARSTPDVLVSDIGLPGMDGCELIRRVRVLPATHKGVIPAIAVTAFARPEDRARVLLAGYQAHVSKPVDAAELTAVVANLLELSKPSGTMH